ncbi:HAMP domain-containing histidine kinase [Alteromonas pelagimontana]|uniref:histidine kinase n=1 Tax=Alteromonas pelagimontana TaxID=1858656 RepID=A0A6M4MEW1_9ALTE|nr:HAMP domain-containing sensor histidine kinase [Alteromonas pelagimontana]QJR81629.1 HAMP domain-containing histidine kinase [Alteromonas pelagimontana]
MKTKACAKYLFDNHEHIFNLWEDRANNEVLAASKTPDLVVRDYLPHFMESLTEALDKYETTSDETQFADINFDPQYSHVHGRARAAVQYYDLRQVMREYAILRQVIREELKKNDLLCFTSLEIIDRFIESSSLEAGQLFVDSIKEVQDKLISVIAHDLRNPISVASSYIEVGEEGLMTAEKVFPAIKRSLAKALKLIGDLLDANQVKAGNGMTFRFERCDMVEEVTYACNEAKEVYANQVHFKSKIDSAVGIYDKSSVHRVLENLISNAIKYGGVDTAVNIAIDGNDNFVTISVHNTGSYIKQEEQASIFNFLSREDNAQSQQKEGWGLGLFLVKVVAAAHKGDAWVESSLESGTTFFIKLNRSAHKENTAFSNFL